MKPSIQILLSTYNGELYLREQINSLLSQKDIEVHILIRDDGSTDKTINIIEEYSKKNENIEYYKGKNLGFAKSFWDLLCHDTVHDYALYAFCDQDDVWEKNKLLNAAESIRQEEMRNPDKPILYTSNVQYINEESKPIYGNEFTGGVINRYESFLKSILPGCTFVFNFKAKNILAMYQGFMIAHDWAAYAIINAMGIVLYDQNSAPVLYRLHGNNTIGIQTPCQKFFTQIRRFFKKKTNARSRFAKDFYITYKEYLSDKEFSTHICWLAYYRDNFSCRVRLLFGRKFKGLIFRLYVLLGRM